LKVKVPVPTFTSWPEATPPVPAIVPLKVPEVSPSPMVMKVAPKAKVPVPLMVPSLGPAPVP